MADADIASNPVDETNLSSPTFEEAFSKASGTLSSTDTEKESEPTQAEPEAPEQEPEQQETKEADFDQFDPEKLPEELKPVYENLKTSYEKKMKDLDKGFTQGRQKDREELNQLKQEVAELRKAREEGQPQQQETPEEYIDRIVKSKVTEEKLEAFRDQALNDFNSLDPRLTQPTDEKPNDKYDQKMDAVIAAELDRLLQEHIDTNGTELGFDYKSHGERLVAEWDSYIKNQVDAFLAKQREVAKKTERVFQKSNPKSSTSSAKPSSNMTLEQAVQAAYRKATT